ncbi:uncharacterized protein LOC110620909 [Manihot esculenta]|uniref:COPII coat assembly protein SEC16 n=1 Tax=Manihot esculenta TaxID=3983 RepID=A0A2C9VEJ5_MANES|nr:uncharacterized protein LOC110620909 [Manihot esculenta]OAY42971.1 hypothetical protein MANES_08G031500v8 [Manihot esculenta]
MDEAGPTPALRRRNSIATSVVIPTKLTLPFHTSSLPPHHTNGNGNGVVSSPPLDFDLSAYTSLKDVLPSTAINSPTAATPTGASAFEISIRNRLVKQAAWAYLQPMSSSPDSSSQHFLRRLWLQISTCNPITSCIRFISLHVIPAITGAFDRILRAIRVPVDR